MTLAESAEWLIAYRIENERRFTKPGGRFYDSDEFRKWHAVKREAAESGNMQILARMEHVECRGTDLAVKA